jgi:hypothetical protein
VGDVFLPVLKPEHLPKVVPMSLIRTVGLPMFRPWRLGLVSAASLSILPLLISAVQAPDTVSRK